MMNGVKASTFILIAVAFAVTLVGCGADESARDRPTTQEQTQVDPVQSKQDSADTAQSQGESTTHLHSADVRSFYSDRILQRADSLVRLHAAITGPDSTSVRCETLVQTLPQSFSTFRQIYGYPDGGYGQLGDGPSGPLYFRADAHLTVFFDHKECAATEPFADRMLDISVDGFWQADGVSRFRGMVWQECNTKSDLYCRLLKERSREDQIGFWYFFGSGPHPSETTPDWVKTTIQDTCPSQLPMAQIARQRILEDWGGH